MCFHKDFHDSKLESANSFLGLIFLEVPRGWEVRVSDRLHWYFNGSGKFNLNSIRLFMVPMYLHSLGRVFGG